MEVSDVFYLQFFLQSCQAELGDINRNCEMGIAVAMSFSSNGPLVV